MITPELGYLLGGAGMFLYAMQALTQELKVLASDGARLAIRRFAASPLKGMATGAAVTALVQSSSATMVMTLGLVGAGILSFSQSLGIVLGANVGTTFTGWMVMLLGVKVSLGTLALPLLLLAALGRILGGGAVARGAGVLAGLCLVFLGIELMKLGMAAFDGMLSPERLPAETLVGRLWLLALGAGVTLVTQSSTAGVAAVIVLLSQGQVSFAQGAALVIGMTVGTTFTGLIASLGGTIAMRRTALAHLVFNLTQGLVALSLLDLLLRMVALGVGVNDAALALVAFHTGFTLLGALMFLPLVGPFGRLIARLLPEAPQPAARELDPAFLTDPAAALDIGLASARRQVMAILGGLGALLAPGARPEGGLRPEPAITEAEALGQFLSQIALPAGDRVAQDRYTDLMALVDHQRRLAFRAGQGGRMTLALYEPQLQRETRLLGAILRAIAENEPVFQAGEWQAQAAYGQALNRLHAKLRRLQARLAQRETRLRRRVLARQDTPPQLFATTDAMRWLRRTSAHAERVLAHLQAAGWPPMLPDPLLTGADTAPA